MDNSEAAIPISVPKQRPKPSELFLQDLETSLAPVFALVSVCSSWAQMLLCLSYESSTTSTSLLLSLGTRRRQ